MVRFFVNNSFGTAPVQQGAMFPPSPNLVQPTTAQGGLSGNSSGGTNWMSHGSGQASTAQGAMFPPSPNLVQPTTAQGGLSGNNFGNSQFQWPGQDLSTAAFNEYWYWAINMMIIDGEDDVEMEDAF